MTHYWLGFLPINKFNFRKIKDRTKNNRLLLSDITSGILCLHLQITQFIRQFISIFCFIKMFLMFNLLLPICWNPTTLSLDANIFQINGLKEQLNVKLVRVLQIKRKQHLLSTLNWFKSFHFKFWKLNYGVPRTQQTTTLLNAKLTNLGVPRAVTVC